ncbi:hypothetical protein, partial [Enorma massiliensis]|uniref:hypothetical protein n=1 Tax=Enorma massiliensis TaxID=1472761 RepID=UPI003AF0DB3F
KNIVRVYVKTNDVFTEENATSIQNIVEGITGLSDIQIESKNYVDGQIFAPNGNFYTIDVWASKSC